MAPWVVGVAAAWAFLQDDQGGEVFRSEPSSELQETFMSVTSFL